jgi:DNA-binding CsgD family transcriptional regulator
VCPEPAQASPDEGAALIAAALDAMNAVAFICDGAGRVDALTRAATEWLGSEPGLRLAEDRLHGRSPEGDRLLQSALERAGSPGAAGEGSHFWLRGEGGVANSQLCEVLALPRIGLGGGARRRFLILIRKPADPGPAQRHSLQTLLGLTPAETDVAMLAAEGIGREQIARRRGTSFETVNAQMKSLFNKASVTREAGLVALLNRLIH